MLCKRWVKKSLIILGILIVFPLLYLVYDRSLMPPMPEYKSPPYVPGETWEQYATQFLETNKKPNALEHYLKAYSLLKASSMPELDSDTFYTILEHGWNKSYPEAEKVLLINREAILELIHGAELKQCELPTIPLVPDDSIPRSQAGTNITARKLVRLILLNGRKLEQEKKFSEALHYYFCGIQFGRDLGQNDVISSLIVSETIINMFLYPVKQLLEQNKLTTKNYFGFISDLSQINRNYPNYIEIRVKNSILDSIELHYLITTAKIYKQSLMIPKKRYPLNILTKKYTLPGINKEFQYLTFPGKIYVFFNQGSILNQRFKFYNDVVSAITSKSYQGFIQTDLNSKVPQDLFNHYIMEDRADLYKSTYTRYMIFITQLRLVQIQAAIQLYHLKKKQWPKGLDDLKLYLTEIPVDPFTEKPFLWAEDSTGRPFAYSTGPDFVDNSAKTIYDPTNGTTSPGDIIP